MPVTYVVGNTVTPLVQGVVYGGLLKANLYNQRVEGGGGRGGGVNWDIILLPLILT
jgi:hypothetical protein